MTLSIVILNWNGADMMRRYLPSVIRCSQHDGVEVVVADNGSTDQSLTMLRQEFPQVRVIALDQNYGFAEGYNRALRQVEADCYMLLNSDVEIRQADWLTPIINYMDAHPEVCACQPKLLKLYDSDTPAADTPSDLFEYAGAAGGYIDRFGYPFCRGRIFDTVEHDHGQYDDIVPLHWATGAALVVRSADYWAVGGLDGTFFAHMEEIDLCWRMRRRGGTIVCIPQSTAYHLGGATLSQGNPRKTFLNFRNNLLMLHKNLPQRRLLPVLLVRHLLDTVAALRFLLTGDAANAAAVVRATREYYRIRRHYPRPSVTTPDTLCPCSILWQYYVRGRKHYSELKQ
ncbi:MAG: glycosyltransferase family 2 protein [Prevotellaceae bacterium]|nr:glycosyltransferase family 2 protein [Candidatus Colivivens caballi]